MLWEALFPPIARYRRDWRASERRLSVVPWRRRCRKWRKPHSLFAWRKIDRGLVKSRERGINGHVDAGLGCRLRSQRIELRLAETDGWLRVLKYPGDLTFRRMLTGTVIKPALKQAQYRITISIELRQWIATLQPGFSP